MILYILIGKHTALLLQLKLYSIISIRKYSLHHLNHWMFLTQACFIDSPLFWGVEFDPVRTCSTLFELTFRIFNPKEQKTDPIAESVIS